MKRFLFLIAVLALGAAAPASAQSSSCFDTRLLNATGATIRLSTGRLYTVAPGKGRMEVTLWQPLDKLRVCPGGGSAARITDLSLKVPQTVMALSR